MSWLPLLGYLRPSMGIRFQLDLACQALLLTLDQLGQAFRAWGS
jgi:hypothetical protein